jgi:hypothetical protein
MTERSWIKAPAEDTIVHAPFILIKNIIVIPKLNNAVFEALIKNDFFYLAGAQYQPPNYIQNGSYTDFVRLKFQLVNDWRFSCDKLIPCTFAPFQTCGCRNLTTSNSLAIVYNLNKAGM